MEVTLFDRSTGLRKQAADPSVAFQALCDRVQQLRPQWTPLEVFQVVRTSAEGAALYDAISSRDEVTAAMDGGPLPADLAAVLGGTIDKRERHARVAINKAASQAATGRADAGALTMRELAWSKIEAAAADIRKRDTSLTAEQAIGQALHENPHLYNEYKGPNADLTALELAQRVRDDLGLMKRKAARLGAGEPIDFHEAVCRVAKRDGIDYGAAMPRARSEYPELAEEYRPSRDVAKSAGAAPWSKIEAAAADIQKGEPKLTRAQAIVKAMDRHPELLREYEREHGRAA